MQVFSQVGTLSETPYKALAVAAGAEVAAPFVAVAGPVVAGLTFQQAVGSLLLVGVLNEFFHSILDPGVIVPVHNPDEEPGPEDRPVEQNTADGPP